jgi:L-fucose isomerase-like protein
MNNFLEWLGIIPMRFIRYEFTDRVSGEAVNIYEGRDGRRWMKNNARAMFRVPCNPLMEAMRGDLP